MGLFPNYAMMNHDCIHNTKTFVEMENGCFKVRVIATQIIPPGNGIHIDIGNIWGYFYLKMIRFPFEDWGWGEGIGSHLL